MNPESFKGDEFIKESGEENEKSPQEKTPKRDSLKNHYSALNMLKRGDIEGVNEMLKNKEIYKDFKEMEAASIAAEEGIISCLRKGEVENAVKIAREYEINDDFLQSEEVKQAAEEQILYLIRLDKQDAAQEMKDAIESNRFFFEDFFNHCIIQEKIKEELLFYVQKGAISKANNIIDIFSYSHPEIGEKESQEAVSEGIKNVLNKDSFDFVDIDLLREIFPISDSSLQSPEFQEPAKKALISAIRRGDSLDISRIESSFGISSEFIKSPEAKNAAKEGFVNCVKENNLDKIFEFSNAFQIPDEIFYSPEVKKVIKEDIISTLKYSLSPDWSEIISLIEAFDMQNEVSSLDYKEAAMQGIAICIKNKDFKGAENIKRVFGLPENIS